MNQVTGVVVIVLGVVMGVFGARLLGSNDSDPTDTAQASPDSSAVRSEAAALAEEILDAQVSARDLATAEEEDQIIEGLGSFKPQFETMNSAVTRVADTIVVMEEHAQRPIQKSELDVRRIASSILEPTRLGQLFATSREPAVRRDAITVLARVAARDPVALAAIVALIEDGDDSVRAAAVSSLTSFLSRQKDGSERAAALKATDAERLVSSVFFSAEEGSMKTSARRFLTSLKSQSVAPYWQETFDKYAERPSRQVEAARALKGLGNGGPFDQLLNNAIADLQDTDRRKAGEASRTLRLLGGDAAKAALDAFRKK